MTNNGDTTNLYYLNTTYKFGSDDFHFLISFFLRQMDDVLALIVFIDIYTGSRSEALLVGLATYTTKIFVYYFSIKMNVTYILIYKIRSLTKRWFEI